MGETVGEAVAVHAVDPDCDSYPVGQAVHFVGPLSSQMCFLGIPDPRNRVPETKAGVFC